ncbi:MAG: YMGG-like glycine zipper-containing protein [Desulfovibrionaceae bacterium]
MKKIISLMLVVSLFMGGIASLSGCATTDRGKTQQEGAATGAAGGALLGALMGALVGGDVQSAAVGAAIGAAAGGVAGYAYGTHVADKKAEYAKQEDWLDACIASLEQTNAETRAYNAQLETEIKDLDAQSATLLADYNKKKVAKSALTAEKTTIDKKLAEAQEALKKANWELENQQKVLAEAEAGGKTDQTKNLDARIAELKAEIVKLEAKTDQLASMSSRMAV